MTEILRIAVKMKGALYESCGKKELVSGLSSDHSRNRLMALAINSVFDATGW